MKQRNSKNVMLWTAQVSTLYSNSLIPLPLWLINLILPVQCEWGTWQNGPCSATCGEGTRHQKRSKLSQERNGGKCEGGSFILEPCNNESCSGMLRIQYSPFPSHHYIA